MIKVKKISYSLKEDLYNVKRLYNNAFPENERGPLNQLLNDTTGCSEIFAVDDDGIFCGFIILLSYADISHIIYFAIDDSVRGKGYGSEALKQLKIIKNGYRIVADIEKPLSDALNYSQRKKRKEFYLKNGFEDTGVEYTWKDEAYTILVSGDSLSEKEFWDFWESVSKLNPVFMKF